MNAAFISLIIAVACLYAANGAGGLDWESDHYESAQFGKAVAAYAKENQIIVNESTYHFPSILFYSHREIPKFHFKDIDRLLKDHPDALIISEMKRIDKAGLKGDIVLRQSSPGKKRPQVLFKPSPSIR